MNKGVFIAIEGIDGSGKTKTIKTLSNFLNIKTRPFKKFKTEIKL